MWRRLVYASTASWDRRDRVAPLLAGLAVLATAVVAVRWQAWFAAGADAYGYVSQAFLWMRGELRVPQALAMQAPWPDVDWTLSPLGYRPATVPGSIVPTYPPGLPLAMAAAGMVAGARAVFWVVPLAGVAVVWLTYRLGCWMASPATGAFAAVVLCSSAVFVHQLVVPMSDVPATAWWLLALLLVARRHPLLAGAAATAALLTRPNLAPLALWLAVGLAVDQRRCAATWRSVVRAEVAYAAPLACGLGFLLWLNAYLYGNPFHLGYGGAASFYRFANVTTNLARYARWLWDTQTFFPFVGLAAPVVFWMVRGTRRALHPGPRTYPLAMAFGIVGIVVASYLAYLPFDDWRYLRFLLPGLPLLLILSAEVMMAGIRRLPVTVRAPLMMLGLAAIVTYQIGPGRSWEVRTVNDIEARYAIVGRAAARILPPRAVLLSWQQSGSLRFYSGRETLRYDLLDPAWLDRAVSHLQTAGYQPYLVLESFEEEPYRRRFGASSALGRLDWPPFAESASRVTVRIFDLLARDGRVRSGRADTLLISPDVKAPLP